MSVYAWSATGNVLYTTNMMIMFSVLDCVLFLVLVATVAYQFRFRVQNRRREKLEQEFNKGPE
jgi:hypothetical protein